MPKGRKAAPLENRTCPTCSSVFVAKIGVKHQKKFCNITCATTANRGKKRTPETISKMTAGINKTFREHPEIGKMISEKRKGIVHSESTRRKISATKAKNISERGFSRPRKYQTDYVSTKTGLLEVSDSSYELRRFKFLDESPLVKTWTKRHKIRIKYSEGKKKRHYLPDILVEYHDGTKYLEEVKGYVFDRMNFARKNLAAMMYCRNRGITFRIVREADLEVLV